MVFIYFHLGVYSQVQNCLFSFLFCSDNFAIIQVEHERTRKLLVIVLCNSFENGKGIILTMICRNELLLLEKKNQAIKWKCEMSRKKNKQRKMEEINVHLNQVVCRTRKAGIGKK